MKAFVASIQMEQNGWYLHYGWMYWDTTFEGALTQAQDHFYNTQTARLTSIHLTDGKEIFYERTGEHGERVHEIVSVGDGFALIGPATERNRK